MSPGAHVQPAPFYEDLTGALPPVAKDAPHSTRSRLVIVVDHAPEVTPEQVERALIASFEQSTHYTLMEVKLLP